MGVLLDKYYAIAAGNDMVKRFIIGICP
jgi:hypothetical protein